MGRHGLHFGVLHTEKEVGTSTSCSSYALVVHTGSSDGGGLPVVIGAQAVALSGAGLTVQITGGVVRRCVHGKVRMVDALRNET